MKLIGGYSDAALDGGQSRVLPLLFPLFTILILGLLAAILLIKLYAPIGPMYWDSHIYFDAANRINSGQQPSLDFATPVGPINYWFATFLHNIFPNGQPILVIHWSMLLLTAPLISITCWDIARRSPWQAAGIFFPFMLFAVFPFGTVDFFPFPGTEGFGPYNRHGAMLIYIATTIVFFTKNRYLQGALLAACAVGLFLGKITAFFAALLIVGYAFLAGFVSIISLVTSLALFLIALAGIHIFTGVIPSYILGILDLLTSNQSSILPRFLTVFSQRMDVILACGLLIGSLFIIQLFFIRQEHKSPFSGEVPTIWDKLFGWLRHDFMAIGFVLLAGIFFETQNTGSQAFIMLWPIIFLVLVKRKDKGQPFQTFIIVLAMAAVLPTLTKITHKGLRTIAVAPTYEKVQSEHLGVMGQVTAKNDFMKRVEPVKQHYIDTVDQLDALAGKDILPSSILMSEPDFQVLWLTLVDEAISAIEELEATRGVEYETIFTLDFTNPFPFLMDKTAPKYVQIGADPLRTFKVISSDALAAVAETDIVLRPTCPKLSSVQDLYEIYKDSIEPSHEKIRLTDCYEAYIKPNIGG